MPIQCYNGVYFNIFSILNYLFLFYFIFFFLFCKELDNVGVIYAESEKELTLETIKSFKSNDVMVVGGDKTNYTCKYIDTSNYIIYIEPNKSFIMDGGLLKYGIPNSGDKIIWNHFCVISGFNSYFNIRYVKLKFVSKMYFFTYITGGVVCIEYLKIENEVDNWAFALFVGTAPISSVIIELFSIHITNSYYNTNNKISHGVSGICYISESSNLYSIILNISSLLSYNNIFSVECGFGGSFFFTSLNTESGFSFPSIISIIFICSIFLP
jgi:hypothetical protein